MTRMAPADEEAAAQAFVAARRAARALPGYPGRVPTTLAEGYAVQEHALARWPVPVAGWKVGWIAPARRDGSGEDRVTGPIFKDAVRLDRGGVTDFPVFDGGFAAVEAEYAFRLARDADPARLDWSAEDAAALVAALHIGVETAGSPLATINELGPAVVAADFGNNAGLILGREIEDWRERPEPELRCATWIEGREVGRGGAAGIPGGLLGALAFALGRCARRGRSLRAGTIVTTGATTGIHDIVAGQEAVVRFEGLGEIRCRAVPARARSDAG